jgi:N-acetylglutamate synthase-like GNAT family acetyltransferase
MSLMALKLIPIQPVEYDALAGLLEQNNLLASDLEGEGKRFFAFEDQQGWRIGVGGLELIDSYGLLRSFLTMNAHRGQGLGGAMLEELVSHARSIGLSDLFLFSEDATGFFSKHGFAEIERSAAPAQVQQTRQFLLHSKSATFMHRSLTNA